MKLLCQQCKPAHFWANSLNSIITFFLYFVPALLLFTLSAHTCVHLSFPSSSFSLAFSAAAASLQVVSQLVCDTPRSASLLTPPLFLRAYSVLPPSLLPLLHLLLFPSSHLPHLITPSLYPYLFADLLLALSPPLLPLFPGEDWLANLAVYPQCLVARRRGQCRQHKHTNKRHLRCLITELCWEMS